MLHWLLLLPEQMPWQPTMMPYNKHLSCFSWLVLNCFLNIFLYNTTSGSSRVTPLSRALIASSHWPCHTQNFYFASSHWPCHMHKQWHFHIYFLLFSFFLHDFRCQGHFRWFFPCHHRTQSDCFHFLLFPDATTTSRAMPLHLEWHHHIRSNAATSGVTPLSKLLLLPGWLFSFFPFLDIGCHLSLWWMPHHFSWLLSFFNCCQTPPPHPEQCHFLQRDATSSGVTPVSGAFIASWLIVFFPFFPRQMPTLLWLIVFFLSLLPDATATPLHAEWCHFIRSFYWFLVVFFFPFFKPPFIATDAHTALVDCFLIVSRWCNFIWSFYWCQCPFGWLFLSLIVATTASRMMPLHPERHHVDCFLFLFGRCFWTTPDATFMVTTAYSFLF